MLAFFVSRHFQFNLPRAETVFVLVPPGEASVSSTWKCEISHTERETQTNWIQALNEAVKLPISYSSGLRPQDPPSDLATGEHPDSDRVSVSCGKQLVLRFRWKPRESSCFGVCQSDFCCDDCGVSLITSLCTFWFKHPTQRKEQEQILLLFNAATRARPPPHPHPQWPSRQNRFQFVQISNSLHTCVTWDFFHSARRCCYRFPCYLGKQSTSQNTQSAADQSRPYVCTACSLNSIQLLHNNVKNRVGVESERVAGGLEDANIILVELMMFHICLRK